MEKDKTVYRVTPSTLRAMEYSYYQRLEKEWRAGLPQYTPLELLKVYPEGRVAVARALRKKQLERRKRWTLYRSRLKVWEKIKDPKEKLVVEAFLDVFHAAVIAQLDTDIDKLKTMLGIVIKNPQRTLDLDAAKRVPIIDVAMKLGIEVRLNKCLCPNHKERTPSCVLYPETNSFFCFACTFGGDVVKFVQKVANLEFVEAVKWLTR